MPSDAVISELDILTSRVSNWVALGVAGRNQPRVTVTLGAGMALTTAMSVEAIIVIRSPLARPQELFNETLEAA